MIGLIILSLIILVFLVMISFFIFIYLFALQNETIRVKKLKDWAKKESFSFCEEKKTDFSEHDFYFFNKKGYLRRGKNFMKGKKYGYSWEIFDYYYNTSGSSHHMHTIFIIKCNKPINKREKGYKIISNGKKVLCWKLSGKTKPENIPKIIAWLREEIDKIKK